MRITVAMCTFNGERYLGEQLRSIAAQSRRPDEIVVCDDGSTDGTLEILESSPIAVRVHRNTIRLGVVRNFEQAIALATGDVVVMADQDDIWHRERLERTESLMAGADCLFSNARRIDAGGRPYATHLWDHIGFTPRQRIRFRRGRAFELLLDRNVATGATMAFRAALRKAILPFPLHEGMLHDRWIALIASAIGRITCVDESLIDYREHEAQEVGAGEPAAGMARWIEAARQTGASVYAARADALTLVAERLAVLGAPQAGMLEQRIAHLRVRANLPAGRLARVPLVIREMPRYFRHSRHLISAGKDLLWK